VAAPAIEPETKAVVQAGELVPESRPEPVTFVTANEGLEDLTLKENTAQLNGATASPPTVLADNLEQIHQDSQFKDAAFGHSFKENMMEQVAQAAH